MAENKAPGSAFMILKKLLIIENITSEVMEGPTGSCMPKLLLADRRQ